MYVCRTLPILTDVVAAVLNECLCYGYMNASFWWNADFSIVIFVFCVSD